MIPPKLASVSPEERIEQMSLQIPEVPTPVAAYVPAVRVGQYIYTSGQLPLVNGVLLYKGKTGDQVSPEQAYSAAQQCTLNALAAIRSIVGDLSAIKRIVKVVGFVSSATDFFEQPAVINGASELLGKVFGETTGAHARSAVGVAALPLDAPVEVELIVEI